MLCNEPALLHAPRWLTAAEDTLRFCHLSQGAFFSTSNLPAGRFWGKLGWNLSLVACFPTAITPDPERSCKLARSCPYPQYGFTLHCLSFKNVTEFSRRLLIVPIPSFFRLATWGIDKYTVCFVSWMWQQQSSRANGLLRGPLCCWQKALRKPTLLWWTL